MPSVGDLYVNLGIKGSDKTVGQIEDTKKGMGELKSMSLEAKAAILAVAYGFEQMMSQSSRFGTHLSNLSTYLGLPPKILQQYIWAGKQTGIAKEQIEGTFKSLESIMANLRMNKGVPEF